MLRSTDVFRMRLDDKATVNYIKTVIEFGKKVEAIVRQGRKRRHITRRDVSSCRHARKEIIAAQQRTALKIARLAKTWRKLKFMYYEKHDLDAFPQGGPRVTRLRKRLAAYKQRLAKNEMEFAKAKLRIHERDNLLDYVPVGASQSSDVSTVVTDASPSSAKRPYPVQAGSPPGQWPPTPQNSVQVSRG